MFRLLSGDIESSQPELADKIYRFRHDFFVERLKWEACRKPDGRERDQFDGPENLHVVGLEHDAIVSYSRLLPTTRPHLQTHVYPEILQGAVAPSGPGIYEWTRHAVAPSKREAKGPNTFSTAAFAAVAKAVEMLGLKGLLVQTHPVLVDRLMDMGWDVEPLALPITYENALLLPIYARFTSQTLTTCRHVFSQHRAELRIDRTHRPSALVPDDRLIAV